MYIVREGRVEVSLKVIKPHKELDNNAASLMKEKFLLKDCIHGIKRYDTIEGNDTGLMGANEGWMQVPKTSEQYVERMEKHRIAHEETLLRQRIITADTE